MPPNYDYQCDACGLVEIHFVKYDDRDTPGIPCTACHTNGLKRLLTMPSHTKASFVDGQRKFTDMREANKLVQEAAVSKPGTAREIRKEIKKMGVKVEQ